MRPPLVLPPRLRRGDIVAIVSPSWGGPAAVPHRYDAGIRQLEDRWGLVTRPMPHALADPAWIAANPAARADDLHAALRDDDVRAIVASIGGDDSIRVLPHLDVELVRARPKALLGFSDTTCLHAAWMQAGIVSFYGSSVLCAFAENGGMHEYFVRGIQATLFDGHVAPGPWPENRGGWTVERLEWERPETQDQVRALRASTGWRWIQGAGRAAGPLVAANIEVLDWLRGTRWWPDLDGAILALETSEEQPSPQAVGRMLRSLAAIGDLGLLRGLLFGRPGGHLLEPSAHGAYDESILHVVRDECGLTGLTVVSGMDFGHTDPPWTLPLGVRCEVDADARTVTFAEPCVA